jgi:hypothetical protein
MYEHRHMLPRGEQREERTFPRAESASRNCDIAADATPRPGRAQETCRPQQLGFYSDSTQEAIP